MLYPTIEPWTLLGLRRTANSSPLPHAPTLLASFDRARSGGDVIHQSRCRFFVVSARSVGVYLSADALTKYPLCRRAYLKRRVPLELLHSGILRFCVLGN